MPDSHRYGLAAAVAAVLVWPGGPALAEEAQASCAVTAHAFKYLEVAGPGIGGLPFEMRSYRVGAYGDVETAVVRSDGNLLSMAEAEADASWQAQRWLRPGDLEPQRRQGAPEPPSQYLPRVVRLTEACGGEIETAEFIGEHAQSDHLNTIIERLEGLEFEVVHPGPSGYLRLEPLPSAMSGPLTIDHDFDRPEVTPAGFWEQILALPGKLLSVEELAAADPQARDHGIDPGGNRIVRSTGHLFVLSYYQ